MEQNKEYKTELLDRLKEDRFDGQIPDGYLESLAQKSWADQATENHEVVQLVPKQRSYIISQVAAALALLIGSYFILQQFTTEDHNDILFAELSDTDLMEYAEENIYDFNTEIMWESLNFSQDELLLESSEQETLDWIDLEEVELYLIQETL